MSCQSSYYDRRLPKNNSLGEIKHYEIISSNVIEEIKITNCRRHLVSKPNSSPLNEIKLLGQHSSNLEESK